MSETGAAGPEEEPLEPAAAGWARARRWSGEVAHVMLLADGSKPEVAPRLREVEDWLQQRGLTVEVEDDVREFAVRCARVDGQNEPSCPAADLVVVLGGDGSVLTAVRAFGEQPVPILGINYGRVGFLAPVEAPGWREGLSDVLDGRALVESRMRLSVDTGQGPPVLCLNDAVLTREATGSMVRLNLRADGRHVAQYRADGLIVATPSGSTAYTLAAGGPVLGPTMEALVVTPISAHALSHRPLVLGAGAELEVEVASSEGVALLVMDGRGATQLPPGARVRITRHAVPYPLLVPAALDPWRRLRDRLGWSGSFEGRP